MKHILNTKKEKFILISSEDVLMYVKERCRESINSSAGSTIPGDGQSNRLYRPCN